MINVSALTKYFGPTPALREVTFQVKKGEVVGFLGPNGAGKTTLMRILAGFFPPTSGRAEVAGFDVIKSSLEVRENIGYFLEKAPLYPEMRVIDFLHFVAEVKKVPKSWREKAVFDVMTKCGLEKVRHRIIGNISKGYRQRVGLAQALVNDPKVLLLDEPTVGLDPEQIVEIRKLIKALRRERTIILSTHILPEASSICNRIIIINEGRIVAVDTPEGLRERVQTSTQMLVRVEGPTDLVRKGLQNTPGVLNVQEKEKISENISDYLIEINGNTDFAKDLCTLSFNNKWVLREIRPLEMGLEEIFLKLVTKEKNI